MDWLNKIIPTIGGLLAGPLGTAAASAAADALGLSDKSKAAVERALGGGLTTEQMASLQTADAAFKQKLAELGIEAEKLSVQDRADARATQIATRSWVPAALACTITIGFFGIVIGLMTGDLKLWDNNPAMTILMGSLTTAWGSIVAFYYGSSHQQTIK